MDTKTIIKSSAVGTVIGATAGVIATLLLTPKTGKEVRQQIVDGTNLTKEAILEKGTAIRAKIQTINSAIAEKAKEAKNETTTTESAAETNTTEEK